MTTAARFLDLHRPGEPLLMPNPWDAGSARLLESLGFQAVATTSSGSAATLGRLDGGLHRDQAIAHAAGLVDAVGIPVSADLEDGFADDPSGVAATVEAAIGVGLAGCSIEDFTRRPDDPIYPMEQAIERIEAAAEVAGGRIVLTARAENHLHGVTDLADTIDRLQRYAAAGAHVCYAPGLRDPQDIRTAVAALDVPVNVLLLPGGPSVAELADLGVARVSLGGALMWTVYAAVIDVADQLRGGAPYSFWDAAARGRDAARAAFTGGA